MSNQKSMWDGNHAANTHGSMVGKPQKFAEEVAPFIKPGMKLLELEVDLSVFDRNGHLRHFFSVDHTKMLLAADFEAEKINEVEGVYDGFTSAFVQV